MAESYDSKGTSVGSLDAEKLVAAVLLYVLNIEIPASLLPTKESLEPCTGN